MHWLRTFFRCSNWDNSNLTLDILVTDAGVVSPNVTFVGWWGKIKSSNVQPVIVQTDGRLDLGRDEETDQTDRFGFFDLDGRLIKPGEDFVLTAWGCTYDLKIESCSDLTKSG